MLEYVTTEHDAKEMNNDWNLDLFDNNVQPKTPNSNSSSHDQTPSSSHVSSLALAHSFHFSTHQIVVK